MLLIIPLKAPTRYDLQSPLVEWLDGPKEGTPADPMEYVSLKPSFASFQCRKDLKRLASLRNCLSDAITKAHSHKHALDDEALRDCHEYHAALLEFEKRGFPTRNEVAPHLRLEWRASVGPSKETHGSLVWERGCTLWNIAALESFLASSFQRDKDKESLKMVAKHSQNAAAAMRYLQAAIEGQSFEGVDLSVQSTQFWEKAMLAQAQMAAYEMASSSKQSLQSYLAMGAVGLWNEALALSQDTYLVSAMPKPVQEWGAECKAHSLVLKARAEYHQALHSREGKDWGNEIARLQNASEAIAVCVDFYQKSGMDTLQVVALQRFIDDRLSTVVRENRLYGEEVPKSVPNIQAHVIAKLTDKPMPDTMTQPKVPLFTNLTK